MKLERRALYNLLRMNWLQDSEMDVEEWQVADYRRISLNEIIGRLEEKEIYLDQDTFHAFAETFDTPEELSDSVLESYDLEPEEKDEAYLLLFEIWRRLLPEKPCLSIFCDELDQLIHSYDEEKMVDSEKFEDVLANLQVILDENADEGMKPEDVYKIVVAGCANDVESFLYDYIADQLDVENIAYAGELFEGFNQYLKNSKWFKLLECRILSEIDPDKAEPPIQKMIRQALKEPDLQYYLDILSFLIQGGEKSDFRKLAIKSLEIFSAEEDFQDLLSICADYYECLDEEEKEDEIQKLIDQRSHLSLDGKLSPKDPDLSKVRKILT